MEEYIRNFLKETSTLLEALPSKEIAKALNILQAVYERDGRIYICGNGGSLALASHWVGDFNKTVFSHRLDEQTRRFQAIRLPTTEVELSAWANDVGFDMVFAGPLQNYLRDHDCLIVISSSGNSSNIVKAAELAKKHHIPVIGLCGFDGGKINEIADVKILVKTGGERYDLVESVHGAILHLITKYFQDYFDNLAS